MDTHKATDFVTTGAQSRESQSAFHMLKLVLDTMPQPVLWKDQNFVYQGCNAAFLNDTGGNEHSIIGKTDFDISDEATAKKSRAEDEQIMKSGRPLLDFEIVQRTHGDGKKWVSVSKLPLRDDGGSIIGVLGIFHDLTEQKIAEDSLRVSEERFTATFERSVCGMSLTAAKDGRFLQVNQVFCDMLGFSEEELRGTTFQELRHPDGLDLDTDRLDLLMSGEVDTALVEKCYLHKDGDDVWVLVSAAMVRDTQGRPLYVISQVLDISERKATEAVLKDFNERMHILFDCAPDAYFLLDHNGVVIDGNQAAEELTGYHRLELFRRNFSDVNLLSTSDMRTMEKCLADVTQNKASRQDQFTLMRRDGSTVPVEMRSLLMTVQDFPMVLNIARDTSERKYRD